jgi:hypothetical protein
MHRDLGLVQWIVREVTNGLLVGVWMLALIVLASNAGPVIHTAHVGAGAGAVRHFKSCAALNGVYQHGVGKKGAHDRTTSGDPVRNFYRNTRLYLANNGPHRPGGREYDLDRDNDGVACEQH